MHRFAVKQIYICGYLYVCVAKLPGSAWGYPNRENRKSLCSYHELIAVHSHVSVVSRCTSVLIRGRTASHFSFLCQFIPQNKAMALAYRCQKLFFSLSLFSLSQGFWGHIWWLKPEGSSVFRACNIHISSSKKQWSWICLVVTEISSHNDHWKETMLPLPEKEALTLLKVSLAA